VAVVDPLTPEAVLPLLRGRFGRPYRFETVTESTQRLLSSDAPEGAVAVADAQTAGRGRLGRRWLDAPGKSLLFSLSLRPPVPPQRLPELSLVAGDACAAAISAQTGLAPQLKFPNDVLLGGRKVAGMLAEAREGHVVLGVGVNVNLEADELPTEVDTPATSLLVETGAALPRAPLLAELLVRLERRYDEWIASAH
jgi:BirA family biotin operon repressor/biotin-[acetyl-CoA-carboxylase] ligase